MGEWTCERQVQGQLYPEVSCNYRSTEEIRFFLLFQKTVLATWIPDMLVLPLDFKLSLTHSHVTAFISEEWWEACGWWPHSHLEISPVSVLVSCSHMVTFFFFLMGLLIPLWYVGFPSPHLHQHPVFFHQPAKSTSFQGASCFSIITAGLRLPPAPWPLPSVFFFYTLTTDATCKFWMWACPDVVCL